MNSIIRPILAVIAELIGLFRKKTPANGRGIAKGGITSLGVGGLISAGKLMAGPLDTTLLLVLSILEIIAYLLGGAALAAGGAQVDPKQELTEGRADGLTGDQAKVLGRVWLEQARRNTDFKPKSSLFDDDLSDLNIKAKDISHYNTNN